MAASSSSFIPTSLTHADNQGEGHSKLATVADKINDLTFPQGINSVAATSDQKTAQLEQQIAQLTQQVSELTNFMKCSRSAARN
ncbi:hypothetical protein TNCV_1881181 [Trichonephila clavipes]|nr:hypothetical protein TNCV_1881181 [Trichonephila clavipes]